LTLPSECVIFAERNRDMPNTPIPPRRSEGDKLAELREAAAEEMSAGVSEWQEKYAKLQGIADVVMGKKDTKRSGNRVMAKKLCCYYMREAGFPYQVIANTVGLTNHATALFHANTCKDYLDDKWGDREYRIAHKKAIEMGIA
jgi:hypothetical protein